MNKDNEQREIKPGLSEEERQALHKEWFEIQERMKGEFVNPKDMRRSEQITSLLVTDGHTDSIKFNFLRGRGGNKGLNAKKPYYRKGKVG